MSQLNEDGVGIPSDPTQTTITNFIILRNTSSPRKDMDEQISFGPDISDHDFMNDEKSDFSIGCHETNHTHRDPMDCNDSSELHDDNHTVGNSACEVEKFHKSSSDVSANKVGICMQYCLIVDHIGQDSILTTRLASFFFLMYSPKL